MSRFLCLALVCSMGASSLTLRPARAEDLTDATEILKKADAAAKAVDAVKYMLSAEPLGATKQTFAGMESTMIATGEGQGIIPSKFILDVMVDTAGSAEKHRYVLGGDGENYYIIDYAKKKAHVDMDPKVIGSYGENLLRFATMAEFLHPTPFTDEINGDKKELLGSKTVGGEDCYQVHVVYAGGRIEATWFFSKKDFLPRQREDKTSAGAAAGGVIRTINKLEVAPKIDDATFAFKLPEGFEKTDEFAP